MTAASRLAETNAELIVDNRRLTLENRELVDRIHTVSDDRESLAREGERLRGEVDRFRNQAVDLRTEKDEPMPDWEAMYQAKVQENAGLRERNLRGELQVEELLKQIEGEAQRANEMTDSRNATLDELALVRSALERAKEENGLLHTQIDEREVRITAASLSGGDVTRARQLFDFITGSSDIVTVVG